MYSQQQQSVSNYSLTDTGTPSEMKAQELLGQQPESSRKALFMTPLAIERESLQVEPDGFAQPKHGGKYSRLRRELCLANRSGRDEGLRRHGGCN